MSSGPHSFDIITSKAGLDCHMQEGKNALIIVDVQNDFCDGGALAVDGASEIITVINRMRTRNQWDGVYVTLDWHPQDHISFASNNDGAELFSKRVLPNIGEQVMWPDHCVQNTQGAKLHPELLTGESDKKIYKGTVRTVDSYSGFGDAFGHQYEKTSLENDLHNAGVKNVFICGLALDYCVKFTCIDAAKAGFNVFCILDACKAIDLEKLQDTFVDMQRNGIHLVKSGEIVT